MPIITSIKPQKNGKRVNIYLDGEFGFGFDLENYVKLGLKVGNELSEEEVEKIKETADFRKIYDKILMFSSLRPRSEKEYKDWIHKHKVPGNLHQELFNRLKRLDFLNDKKFASWWLDQRQSFRPKSKRILNFELRIKGIKKETIEEVLSKAKIDEVGQAKKILEKKKYLWRKLDAYETKIKKSQYLVRQGFNWETIRKVVPDVDQEE